MNTTVSTGAGKGDKPRNCFSKQFKDNYDLIKWERKSGEKEPTNDTQKENKDD